MAKLIEIKYSQTPQGKAALHKADIRRRQTKKFRISQKLYQESKKGRATQKAGRKKYLALHPKRYKARCLIGNAIQSGKVPRAKTLQCHYCPEQAVQYHHYLGYEPEHWLDIVPVCRKCHQKNFHKKIKRLDVA